MFASQAVGCAEDDDHDDSWEAVEEERRVPALLTLVSPEPAGGACVHGGQRIQVGLDDNANASLEAHEVRSSTIVCNGAGAEHPVASAELPVATCPTPESPSHPAVDASWHRELVLSGAGFVSLGNVGQPAITYFARKVLLHLDKDACLSTGDDLRLQGFPADDRGLIASTLPLAGLCLPRLALPSTPTTHARFSVNLDSNSIVPANSFNPASPASTSNFPSSLTVYDSLGNGHQLTVYFNKTSSHGWEWHALVDGSEINSGTPGVPFEGASGTLLFAPDGSLGRDTQLASTWDFVSALPMQQIDFDFGTSSEEAEGGGLDGTTNFASPSSTNALVQDGHFAGVTATVDISSNGLVSTVYTNEQRRVIGQIPIVSFPDTDRLGHACGELWVRTAASGEPTFGDPQTFGRGSFVPLVF